MSQQGAQARMCCVTGSGTQSWGASSHFVIFNTEDLRLQQAFVESHGVRGTRGRHAARRVAGQENVAGNITLHPTPNDLLLMLYWILGTDRDGSKEYLLAETVPAFAVMIDRVNDVYEYEDCKVASATFSATAGSLVELSMDIVGLSESRGNSWVTLDAVDWTDSDEQPFFFNPSIVIDGQTADTFEVENWSLTIDNQLATRFGQSKTPANLEAEDRIITMSVTCPFDSAMVTLIDELDDLAGLSGANTLTFTGLDGAELVFTLYGLKASKDAATVGGRNEIMKTIDFTVLSNDAVGTGVGLVTKEMKAKLTLAADP